MRKPVIGITSYGRNEDQMFSLPTVYIDAVRRAGGIPLLIPPGEPALPDLFPLLDGVILSGGGDIDPQRYNGSFHETIYMIDLERDSSEIDLTRLAVSKELPLLGICRGAQVINVALGGTLIEHLPEVVGETVSHYALPRAPVPHEIRIETDSKLAAIMGQTNVVPASWHHQAIRQLAPGLQMVAHAPDGTIEAVEMRDHPWLIAVQWHPELSAETAPDQQRLFDDLVRAARQGSK